MKRATVTISFRVNQEVAALLKQVSVPVGLSAGEYARMIVTQSFDDQSGDRLTEELIDIRESIAELSAESQATQQGVRKLAFVLLTKLADLPPEAAREAVRQIFLEEHSGRTS